jgi:GMP synthase-like glutamine amidotransferase
MNISEEERYPWLAAEKRLLVDAIAAGERVLGICLGAQLLADVLGGSVTRNPEVEIGWFPVEPTAEAGVLPGFEHLPSHFTALHWHGDTFSIPAGAVRLAGSAACANQGFAWGDGRVIGLQFHLEETPESLALLVENAGHALRSSPGQAGPWIATAAELLSPEAPFADCRALLFDLLDGMMRCRRAAQD